MYLSDACLDQIEQLIGHTFHDKDLLRRCLIDSSSTESNGLGDNNAKLAFLGDAIIEVVVREHFIVPKDATVSGTLESRLRMTSNWLLDTVVREMGIEQWCLRNPQTSNPYRNHKVKQKALATVFEAFVGAIFLEDGFDEAKRFIQRWLLSDIKLRLDQGENTRPKKKLAAWASKKRLSIKYGKHSLHREYGQTMFVIDLWIKGFPPFFGKGTSPGEAKDDAARKALELIAEHEGVASTQ